MKSILIVDDSWAVRQSLRVLLERRDDWRVCGEAQNGRQGVDEALRLRPDLILLDLSMPVMNGFEAARELQKTMPRTPILMFTTFCNPFVEKEALASGVSAVQSKSESIDRLFETVQHLLNPPPKGAPVVAHDAA